MGSFPFIAIFIGSLIVVFLYFWIKNREAIEADNSGSLLREVEGEEIKNNSAVLVCSQYGTLLHINRIARDWLNMKNLEPDLNDLEQYVEPRDNFVELLTHEGQAAFQLNGRWVEASSHYVPASDGTRVVVVMREMKHQAVSSAASQDAVMDVSTTISIINEIGDTVNASMGVELALQVLLEILNKALPSDAGEICIWNTETNFLQQRGWIGDTRYLLTVASQGGGYEPGQGIAGWMMQYNKPIVVGTKTDRIDSHILMKNNPYVSAVGVPIWLMGDFVGTAAMFSNEAERYSSEDVSLLQAVSKAVGQAIRNAELYAKQEDRIRDIASLQQIAEQPKGENDSTPIYALLNQRMAKLLDSDMCGVLLYEEAREALVPQLPFHGLHDNVAANFVIPLPKNSAQYDIWANQPYWVSNDVKDEPLVEALNFESIIELAGINNTALFPMQIAGERIGVMAISNKRTEGGFMPNDIQNLRVLSSQAAIVVENVRLYQRERRIDTELVGLQEMTHAIGALSHEGEFYQEISERIARLMECEMCGVLLYDSNRNALISQMPFYGVDDDVVRDYIIKLPSGSVMEQLWTEEDYWYSNRVAVDALVYEAGLDGLAEATNVSKTLLGMMSAGGRRIGIVQVSNKLDDGDFDEKDARLLQIFATQAGAIIENARLYREVQLRAEQADRLRRVAELASSIISTEESYLPVLEQIAQLTDSEQVFISVVDYNSNTLITYPRWVYGMDVSEAITQDLTQPGYETIPARSGTHFLSDNVMSDKRVLSGYKRVAERLNIKSVIIVPLAVGDRLIGEIGIGHSKTSHYGTTDISTFSTVAAQIASSVERLLLFEATDENLRRRVEELDAIARVSNELTLTVELDKILETIRLESAKATYADDATVVILHPSGEWADANVPEMDRRIGEAHITGLAPIEQAVLKQPTEPVIVQDYEHHELAAYPENMRSATAAVILYLDQIVGIIHVHDRHPNNFDNRASGFLMTMATKASLAYQNDVLYQQQRVRGERLRQRVEQLNRIFELGQMVQTNTDPVFVLEAIAYSVQHSVGFDTVLMLLVDEETGELHRVAHAGMPLDVFTSTQALTLKHEELDDLLKPEYRQSESYFFPIEDLQEWYSDGVAVISAAYDDNRSIEGRGKAQWHDGDILAVSIMGQGGQLLGLMTLDRPHDNLRPERGTLEVLEIFAHQASTMLENTRLFRESERSAAQEAKLNDTMEKIAGTLNLHEITEELAAGIRDLIHFDRLTMVLVNEQDEAFDYIRAYYDEASNVIISDSQRSTLENTALGHTFEKREIGLYPAGDERVQQYDDLRSWHKNGEQTTIFLPLISASECLGVLHMGSDSPNAFDKEMQQLLIRTSQLVASTVQNARLFNQAVNLQILNRSVVESIQQGIVVLDNGGRIININQFMRSSYGWEDNARGQYLFDYQEELAAYLKDDLQTVLAQGEPRERIGQSSPSDTSDLVVRNFYIYPLRAGEQVRGAVLLVEDVTERTRLEEAIEARANQLAALTEVSTRITASLERNEVIELALNEMGWVMVFDHMSIWRRNASHMLLEGFSDGDKVTVADSSVRIRLAELPMVLQLVDTQRVVAVTNDEIPNLGLGIEENFHSWMGVPLVNQGHVVGMMILMRESNQAYNTRQEQNVAFAFASQVAIALANAELFEQTFERTNELGTLLEAARTTSLTRDVNEVFHAVADLMFGALEMEDCTIMIWNEVDNELDVQFSENLMSENGVYLPVGTTYHVDDYAAREQALRDREVVVLVKSGDEEQQQKYPYEIRDMEETGAGLRMLVPLVVRDQAIGLILLNQSTVHDIGISQQKVRLARALGSQVAVAIENARLTAEATLRFEELLTINQLSQSISSTLNLEDMLPILREQVPLVTRAEELYLALYNPAEERITFPLAVREDGTEFVIPARQLDNDEVSYIIKNHHALSLDDDYFSIDELRKSMRITAGEGDIKSYMGVPLRSGDQVLGVLAIRNITKKRTFNINDDRILTTVGSQLGAAIQNARLFEQIQHSAEALEQIVKERTDELEEERDRLDKLYQITSELARTLDMEQLLERSLDMVSKAVGAHDGVIMLSDPATDNLYSRAWIDKDNLIYFEEEDNPSHPAAGLAEYLIHFDTSGDNVELVDDLNEKDYWDERGRATGLRSALAVMLENNEDPMGVMVLLSKEVGAFTENHLKLLVPAATQVAASINSADLYQLIRDQAERMGKLLRSEQEEAQKHSAIVEAIADGVMLANAKGEIVLFNTAAERILELPREQALGQPVNKLAGIYGSSGLKWTNLIGSWSENSEHPLGEDSVSERLELGDKIIQAQLSPVYIGDLFLGTVSVFRDITRDVEADRAKSKFIENVSHEFRTPLTPIKGYTDLLLMMGKQNMDETQLGMIQTIKENTDRLAALVDDVLRVSKLDSGEDRLHMGLVDLEELLSQVVEQFADIPFNRDKQLNVSVEIEDDLPRIRADRDKLIQVMNNIVDNAFNYTKIGGTIMVSAKKMPDSPSVQIEVADSGVGMPKEFHEAAWRRFERHDPTAVELDVAGTGLGLSLAKDLIQLHNGEIWFESEVGVGTTFFIRLPIEQHNFKSSTAEIPAIDFDETESESVVGD